MRLIGHLEEETAARTFADYLYVQKIESHIEFEKADGWGIWINDEDKLEEAARLLTAFRLNPADPKYRAEAKSAAELRAEAEKDEAKWRKKISDRRHLFQPLHDYGFGPLTFVLIVISVVVEVLEVRHIVAHNFSPLGPPSFIFLTQVVFATMVRYSSSNRP